MPNRLARETSPYLRQHADNPVDWYPWGEEALAEAKRTGKPLLLSVGYSACHWCHVMAHESFEDPATARVMNELFVNVKVDREERPDIDQIYQSAQAMLTRRNGGWPLTMFLTPGQVPFFGGTYFPNTARYGMPAFGDLLHRVREYYDRHPEEIQEQGQALAAAFERMQPAGAEALSPAPLERAQEELAQAFDPEHGGFGPAPKFPHVEMIELLLRRWYSMRDTPAGAQALDMALATLRSMARGGIYDQLGGGFARYSVDAEWAIPHFEKMLYDNALLLHAYADAWAITREPLFARVCEETAAWTMREMQSSAGGYWSSLDADSEGEEGRYYVWSVEEVRALLDPAEFAVASAVYGLDGPPNFEGHAWHLVVAREWEEVARSLGIDAKDAHERLDRARAKLFAARERRVRPGLDDKVLTSWNALMIAGMAHAGRMLGRPEWIASAERALDHLRRVLWRDGRLLATAHRDHAHLDAYLDDHAYLLAALLGMLCARWNADDLEWARSLAAILLERFQDRDEGGFFFTASDHETLIHRPKPGPDNATPSGNAVAAWALNRLSFLTGETHYAEAARATVELFQPALERMPSAFGTMLAALAEQLTPPRTIIVRGPQSETASWNERLARAYLPDAVVLSIPDGADRLPEPLAKPARGRPAAWLCEGATCLAPIDSLEELARALALPAPDPTLHSAN